MGLPVSFCRALTFLIHMRPTFTVISDNPMHTTIRQDSFLGGAGRYSVLNWFNRLAFAPASFYVVAGLLTRHGVGVIIGSGSVQDMPT